MEVGGFPSKRGRGGWSRPFLLFAAEAAAVDGFIGDCAAACTQDDAECFGAAGRDDVAQDTAIAPTMVPVVPSGRLQ
jgi:hypothetical protein